MTKYEVEISARRMFTVEARDEYEAKNIILEDESNLHGLLENLECYVEEIE